MAGEHEKRQDLFTAGSPRSAPKELWTQIEEYLGNIRRNLELAEAIIVEAVGGIADLPESAQSGLHSAAGLLLAKKLTAQRALSDKMDGLREKAA